ncbi:unnamed protein product, partial [Iphiclides podalirius]
MIKELCSDPRSQLSAKLAQKVNRIIAEIELTHYASLHKLSTADESTSTILGVMHQSATELTFDEQSELNHAIVNKIQSKLPAFVVELDHLQQTLKMKSSQGGEISNLRESLNDKFNSIQSQESEKVELMMEWINHRLHDVSKFSENSNELQTLKTKILDLKSKILHLQILQNIYTETNQSIKAYGEIHRQLKDSIMETEQRIKKFKDIVERDYN